MNLKKSAQGQPLINSSASRRREGLFSKSAAPAVSLPLQKRSGKTGFAKSLLTLEFFIWHNYMHCLFHCIDLLAFTLFSCSNFDNACAEPQL